MPSATTKSTIRSAAVSLFNRDGMANVRLQAIADEANVSLGNLTYHYRNKETLIEAIWEDIRQKRRTLLAEFRVLPLFEDLERQLQAVFDLQRYYQFFYIDTADLLRQFLAIATSWREEQEWQRLSLENMLHFNVARGAIEGEMFAGQFADLSRLYWLVSDGWMSRQRSLGKAEDDYWAFRKAIWLLFYPLLTPRGRREYEQIEALFKDGFP